MGGWGVGAGCSLSVHLRKPVAHGLIAKVRLSNWKFSHNPDLGSTALDYSGPTSLTTLSFPFCLCSLVLKSF